MTSSITGYTNEPLKQISEPKCLPDRQAHKTERLIPSCVNEVKAVLKDEKEANTDFAEPTLV